MDLTLNLSELIAIIVISGGAGAVLLRFEVRVARLQEWRTQVDRRFEEIRPTLQYVEVRQLREQEEGRAQRLVDVAEELPPPPRGSTPSSLADGEGGG